MLTMQEQDRWIWPFELVDKIGEGGMGVVYRGRYVVNDRHVAVKLLPTDVTDEVILARFERELEILKTLKHPNIVRCFGGVCENKRRFYAMELVEGGTLDGLLEQYGKLPWPKVVEYGLQMCAALSYSHERGVIHRDVKPGNFLIALNGQLKLSDFGLASVTAARKITAAGKTMGTYRYMAPEQIRGKTEAKSDLYALGCVLFEMLTGRAPFDGETPAEILQKHMREPPPRVRDLGIDCPPSLETLILDLLAKEPEQRPAGAGEVARRLQEVEEPEIVERPRTPVGTGSGVSARPVLSAKPRPETPKRRLAPVSAPNWLQAGAVLALGVLLLCTLWLYRENSTLVRAEELWLEAYRTGPPEVQAAAAQALGQLGTDEAIDALASGLESSDRAVRLATVAAAGETGAAGKEELAPKLLRRQQQDEFPEVRTAAAAAIDKLQQSGEAGGSFWFSALVLLVIGATGGTAAYVWRTGSISEAD